MMTRWSATAASRPGCAPAKPSSWEDVLVAYENEACRLLGVTAADAIATNRASAGTA